MGELKMEIWDKKKKKKDWTQRKKRKQDLKVNNIIEVWN